MASAFLRYFLSVLADDENGYTDGFRCAKVTAVLQTTDLCRKWGCTGFDVGSEAKGAYRGE